MHKMSRKNGGLPPLPPTPSDKYSPSQYSPSQATSPLSEDEVDIPLPPTASRPPKQVLGSDQAKRRLHAFKSQKMIKALKGKVADIFAEDEDEEQTEKPTKIERKVEIKVKDNRTGIERLMQEELELKEKQIILAKKAEETNRQNEIIRQEEKERKKEEEKKREEEKRKEEEKKKEEDKRREEKRRERDEEKRKMDETPKKREKERKKDDEDLREVLERLKRKKTPAEKRSDRSSQRDRDGSGDRDLRRYSRDRGDQRRRRGDSKDRIRSSSRKQDRREDDLKTRGNSGKRGSDGSRGRSGDKSKERKRSLEKRERTNEKDSLSSAEKPRTKNEEKIDLKVDSDESLKKNLFPEENQAEKLEENGLEKEKNKSPKKKGLKRGRSSDQESPVKPKPTSMLEKDGKNEIKSPNKKKKKENNQTSTTDLNKTIEINSTQDTSFDSHEINFEVKPASDADYFEVKNVDRNLDSSREPGFMLVFPSHLIQETSSSDHSIKWSWNPSYNRDPERERLLRASVDSALSELEHEVKAKRSKSQEEEDSEKPKKKKEKKEKKGKKEKKKAKAIKKLEKVEKVKQLLEILKERNKKLKKNKKKLGKMKKENGLDASINKSDEAEVEDQDSEELDVSNTSEPKKLGKKAKAGKLAKTTKKGNRKKKEESENNKVEQNQLIEDEKSLVEKIEKKDKVEKEKVQISNDVAPPLSKAGISKLFELAGYSNPLQSKPTITPVKEETREVAKASPLKERNSVNSSILSELSFPVDKSPSRTLKDKLSVSPNSDSNFDPDRDVSRSTLDDTCSPLHQDDRETPVKDELNRSMERGPRTPSPGLKYPKMRDSRSPTKVPIMRDQRSPLHSASRHDGNDSSPRRTYSPYSEKGGAAKNDRWYGSPGYSEDRTKFDHEQDRAEHGRSRGWDEINEKSRRSPTGERTSVVTGDYLYSPTEAFQESGFEDRIQRDHLSPKRLSQAVSPRKRSDQPSTRSPRGYHNSPHFVRSPLDSARDPGYRHPSPRSRRRSSQSPNYPGPIGEYPETRSRSPYRVDFSRARELDSSRSPKRFIPLSSDPTHDPRPRSFSPNLRRLMDTRAYTPDLRGPSPLRRRVSPISDRSKERPLSSRGYSPRVESSERRGERLHSADRRRYSPGRSPRRSDSRRISPGRSYRSPPRRYSPRRSPGRRSPGKGSPRRGSPRWISPRRSGAGRSPRRDGYDRRSPGRYGSPRSNYRYSPRRRSPYGERYDSRSPRRSPGRGSPRRYRKTPSPGRRGPSPYGRRISPGRRRSLSPRRPSPRRFSPNKSIPLSPRGPYGPDRSAVEEYGRSVSPRRVVRPDSTSTVESDPKLRTGFNNSVRDHEFSNSPQRISLDERLERELGLKRENMEKMEKMMATGLPATIPTYDSIPSLDPGPVTKVPVVPLEKEQAIVAAQMVTSKLLEMQAAKEAERQRRKEQRMAERLAGMNVEQGQNILVEQQKVATGRILEQVEQQELATEELKVKNKKKDDIINPTLITLKPFYRPHEKKGRKKKPETPPQEDWEEYSDVPRSPVPLPDNSTCKPVLVKLGFGVSKEARKNKSVKYRDGMLPGQGSPDRSAPRSPKSLSVPPVSSVKKYKKVRVVVITQLENREEDSLPPPPPPPGSPPRYSTSELIAKYGQPILIKANA